MRWEGAVEGLGTFGGKVVNEIANVGEVFVLLMEQLFFFLLFVAMCPSVRIRRGRVLWMWSFSGFRIANAFDSSDIKGGAFLQY